MDKGKGLASNTILVPVRGALIGILKLQLENGKQFTPAIRALYYQLLADQVPLSKIKTTIKAVIKCFFPSADVSNLRGSFIGILMDFFMVAKLQFWAQVYRIIYHPHL